jgi:tRNA(Ile)-lysidine synthase
MNIMRGSGPEGLGGMSPKTGRYIRPLLETTRAEIEEYCEENGIKHVEDSSNEDTSYFRNSVRHRLLPLMDTISGRDTVKRVSATARMMSLLNSYMDSITENHFEKHVAIRDKRAVVDNAKVMKLHPYMSSCVVRKAVEKVKGDLKDVEYRNTEILLGMMERNRTGEATEIAQGLFALVQFGYTVIYKKDEILPGYEYDLPIPGMITISERNMTVTAIYCDGDKKTDPDGCSHLLNVDCCKEGLKVRTRKNGDIIKPDRGMGTAKLKKYFIDKKTMLPWRNEKMLIACGNSIVFVEGMDYGRDYLPRKGKNIRIEIRREDADA